ncbi:endolytic transglycosylase MltG, partial [Patescibacteria group bacterium]|nr:endolytic transglycosylase MltG [Patescibacteria group bacterium]MBU1890281.1 endolytic transglycosylase MltG [Patescibacteria group bacterium]
LNTGQEVSTIVSIISEGEVVASETEFQVLEGWTAADIARQYGELFSKFISNEASDLEDDFLSEVAVTDSRDIIPGQPYWFLVDKPYMANLEGYLFPDTYRVYKDATPAQIVQKMLNNFEIKLNDELKSKIEQSGLTIFETVTLASIVEKEVRTDKDRRLVADLFLRRMENGMPLQSDATVNYVTGKSELQPTIDDTKMESLYNTYLHQGLPPGPICNPSLASISAVVNPEPNDYVYYLNAPDGQTYFSKTFEGHKINKAKYL